MQQIRVDDPLSKLSFLVVGVARNCQMSIADDVIRLNSALVGTRNVQWFIVESDSTDETIRELSELRAALPNFSYVSLGNLADRMPLRTVRIAYCRNRYVEEIRNNPRYADVDFVIVADFDGLNTLINRVAIETCWTRTDWDGCSANQSAPYYDIWALRHKDWCPGDCWAQCEFLNSYSTNYEANLHASVYARMITIPKDHDWIEVDSAFGGLAIYRRSLFEREEYRGVDARGREVCEHVFFHTALRESGARLFINPALINADYTDHTSLLRDSRWRFIRVKSLCRELLIEVVGRERARSLRRLFRL